MGQNGERIRSLIISLCYSLNPMIVHEERKVSINLITTIVCYFVSYYHNNNNKFNNKHNNNKYYYYY